MSKAAEYIKYSPLLMEGGKLMKGSARPVLSISMLCNGKHREETKKCLQSLQTISDRIDTELIVVDTGCDEEMKRILSSYADKIVPFTWCDDFAKARNAGLKECHGEWFMYVDDDEWFDNTDPIVEFFTSGKYKKFKQAAYIVRNYLDMEGKNYDDFWVGRLTELMEDTHFVGRVHEFLTPLLGECEMIRTFAHHYGYAYKDEEEHRKKARRNIRPLLSMIQEEPNNLHWYSQLVQEYIAIKEGSVLYDFCDGVLKQLDKVDDPEINKHRADFYYGKLIASSNLYDYDRVIEDFNVFRKDRRNNEICMASLYFIAVLAYFKKRDFDHVITYSHRYLNIYDRWRRYEDLSERLNSYGSLTTRYAFSPRNLIMITGLLISSGIETGENDDLFRYFDTLKGLRSDGSQYEYVWGESVDAFAGSAYDYRLVGIADELLSYEPLASQVTARARGLGQGEDGAEKTQKLIRVLGQTKNCRNFYLDYLRFMYEAIYGNNRQVLSQRFSDLILMTSDFFNLDQRLWDTAREKGLDIGAVFASLPLSKWLSVVDNYLDRHDEEQTAGVRKLMASLPADRDIRFTYFALKQREVELLHRGNEASTEEFLGYCRDCVSFYRKIYAKEQFTCERRSSLLPAQCLCALKVLSAGEETSYSGRIAAYAEAEAIHPPFRRLIEECARSDAGSKRPVAFILHKASLWEKAAVLYEACDRDMDFYPVVIPIPYFDKKADGRMGDYHFERDGFPESCHTSYFAEIDLSRLRPEVIFIFAQMDGGNPDSALPAEYYADALRDYTRMLVYVPPEVLSREGAGERIFSQVKEQLGKQ